jgi:superfamily II DNA/RNA helicase
MTADEEDTARRPCKKRPLPKLTEAEMDLLSKSAEFGREGKMGKLLAPAICDALVIPKTAGGMGLTKPTPVQRLALPRLMKLANARFKHSTSVEDLRDVVVQSETGSGKTLAFVIPIVHWLLQKSSHGANDAASQGISRSDGTLVLGLAPTRELCLQVLRDGCKNIFHVVGGLGFILLGCCFVCCWVRVCVYYVIWPG